MKDWIEISTQAMLGMGISAAIIYIAVIILTKVFGKRSFSKMSSFDFAMTVAVGSIIATTVLSPKPSLLHGLIGLLLVYILQSGAAYFRRYKLFEKMIDNTPLLLMDGDKVLIKNLLKARVTETDLRNKLREANITQLSQVKAVVFETTGDISVLHNTNGDEIDSWIMMDVQRR